jgi:hypothetical protein
MGGLNMNRVDAVKLLPGDRIEYAGDRQVTAEWFTVYSGTVIEVTPRGGILIRDDRGCEVWLAYNHVRVARHVTRRPARIKPLHDVRAVRAILKRVVLELGSDAAADALTQYCATTGPPNL